MQVNEQCTWAPQLFGLEARLWSPSPRNLYYFRPAGSQLLQFSKEYLVLYRQLKGKGSAKSHLPSQKCLGWSLEVEEAS